MARRRWRALSRNLQITGASDAPLFSQWPEARADIFKRLFAALIISFDAAEQNAPAFARCLAFGFRCHGEAKRVAGVNGFHPFEIAKARRWPLGHVRQAAPPRLVEIECPGPRNARTYRTVGACLSAASTRRAQPRRETDLRSPGRQAVRTSPRATRGKLERSPAPPCGLDSPCYNARQCRLGRQAWPRRLPGVGRHSSRC